MRRIFVIKSNNPDVVAEFTKTISRKVYNISYINFYDKIVSKPLLNMGFKPGDKDWYKMLNDIEQKWLKLNKNTLYDITIKLINEYASPRAIIFILLNNRHVYTNIKRSFPKYKYNKNIVKSVELFTDIGPKLINTNIPVIDKPDIRLIIPEFNNIESRQKIINRFIITNIPDKFNRSIDLHDPK